MLIPVFLLLSLAAAVIYICLAGFVLWKAALLFAGAFLAVNLIFLLFWCVVSRFSDMTRPIKKQDPLCRTGCTAIAALICGYARVRPHIEGVEKLPENGRFVFVCNHRSMFDPLVVICKLRKYNISFVSKPSNMEIPVAGRLAHGAGFLAIDRENDRRALKTILTAAEYIKSGICSVGIYPEGTRSKTDELLPFHAGSFKIAQRANVPLVIAAVRGSESVTKNMPLHATEVYLDIIEVMPAETVKGMKTQELAEYARERIAARL